MILPSQRRAATLAIHRYGVDGTLLKASGGTTDGYGKASGSAFTEHATERVVRIYQRGQDPSQARVSGGRYRTDSPILLFKHDTAAEEGHRVKLEDATYELDAFTHYPTHIEAETTIVS